MNNQEAIQALLDGKKIRQIDWKPLEYIYHYSKMELNPETKELEPKRGVMFHNDLGLTLPLAQEEMEGCLNRNVEFELYVDVEPQDNTDDETIKINHDTE